jgi:hypothetical protein
MSICPQMVDFGSAQGLSDFETAGIVNYFEDFKRAKTPLWAKRCRLWMDTRSYLKKRILVQGRGGREVRTGGILQYFEDLNRTPNTEIGPKNFFEIASIYSLPQAHQTQST